MLLHHCPPPVLLLLLSNSKDTTILSSLLLRSSSPVMWCPVVVPQLLLVGTGNGCSSVHQGYLLHPTLLLPWLAHAIHWSTSWGVVISCYLMSYTISLITSPPAVSAGTSSSGSTPHVVQIPQRNVPCTAALQPLLLSILLGYHHPC